MSNARTTLPLTVLASVLVACGSLVLVGCGGKKPVTTPAEATVTRAADAPSQLGLTVEAYVPPERTIGQFAHDGAGGKRIGDAISFEAVATTLAGDRVAAQVLETDWTVPLSPSGGNRFTGQALVPGGLEAGRSYQVQGVVLDGNDRVTARQLGPPLLIQSVGCEELQARLSGLRLHFDFDKFDLRADARQTLATIDELLKRYADADFDLRIEGHCDERGTIEYNLSLGEKRANTVRSYLATLGTVPRNRLAIKSFGEEVPLDPAHNEAAWAKNRRAEFKVLCRQSR